MTESARRTLGLTLALLLAALAQSVWADPLRIHGASPDFLTTTAILGALFCDASGGATLGFCAGLIHASLAAPPHGGFGSLIVSMTLVGFAVGWLEERMFRDNPLFALAMVSGGTLLAEGLFFVFAPQHQFGHWGRVVVLTCLYNTVLALPLYFPLSRLVRSRRQKTYFD